MKIESVIPAMLSDPVRHKMRRKAACQYLGSRWFSYVSSVAEKKRDRHQRGKRREALTGRIAALLK